MARPITWREWDATQAAQPLLSARFALTRLGRRALRQAEARRTARAEARPEPQATVACIVVCIWCRTPIRQREAFTVVGGEPMHDAPCREEFDAMTATTDTAEGCDS